MKTAFLKRLQSELSHINGKPLQITDSKQVFGGDINTTYTLITNEERYFIKLNSTSFTDILEKEKDGLTLLRSTGTSLKIPEPILQGIFEQQSFLLMEYLEKGTESKALWQQLAAGLAQLHQTKQNYFGLSYNNYIGTIFKTTLLQLYGHNFMRSNEYCH